MNNLRQYLGAFICILSLGVPALLAQQTHSRVPNPAESAASQSLPDSPGTVQIRSGLVTLAQSSTPQLQQQQSKPVAPTNSAAAQKSAAQQPVGTAAAPPVSTSGNAASEPAGVAIAPAKQKRVRSMLIRVGAILGAGAAIATTMALTKSSPSRPPGAQ